MIHPHMINQIVEWERRLEIEEEQRKNHRYEPYTNYLAAPHPCPQERKSILAWIFQRRSQPQPLCDRCTYSGQCQEAQPG